MTEQDLRAQIITALNAEADEVMAKAALAAVVAHGLMSLQRIADALESSFEIDQKA